MLKDTCQRCKAKARLSQARRSIRQFVTGLECLTAGPVENLAKVRQVGAASALRKEAHGLQGGKFFGRGQSDELVDADGVTRCGLGDGLLER